MELFNYIKSAVKPISLTFHKKEVSLKNLLRSAVIALVALGFMHNRSSAQIPNPGFESWTGGLPDGWFTSDIIIGGVQYAVNVTQSTDRHGGASAVQGAVIDYFGSPYAPLLATGINAEGFAINSRPEALHGWYKLTSMSGDVLDVVVSTKKNGAGDGAGAILEGTPTTTYKEFVVNIIYTKQETPDTAWISVVLANTGTGAAHTGSTFWIDDLSFGSAGATDVKELGNSMPAAFTLNQNYPNPFNPSTMIQFEVPEAQFVTLKVYNVLGQQVATLINNQLGAGRYRAEFDGTNLPSGTYLYRLQAGTFTETKKMLLVK
jgi:hypothetical protein